MRRIVGDIQNKEKKGFLSSPKYETCFKGRTPPWYTLPDWARELDPTFPSIFRTHEKKNGQELFFPRDSLS